MNMFTHIAKQRKIKLCFPTQEEKSADVTVIEAQTLLYACRKTANTVPWIHPCSLFERFFLSHTLVEGKKERKKGVRTGRARVYTDQVHVYAAKTPFIARPGGRPYDVVVLRCWRRSKETLLPPRPKRGAYRSVQALVRYGPHALVHHAMCIEIMPCELQAFHHPRTSMHIPQAHTHSEVTHRLEVLSIK